MRPNIYIAASFAFQDSALTSKRKHLIEKTVERIEKHLNGNYYIPHKLTIHNAWDMSLEDWSHKVFITDLEALNQADVVIFLSFGKENNDGAAWELGYIYGLRRFKSKTAIVIRMTDEPESLMVTNSVERIINESEIDSYDWKEFPEYITSLNKLS